MLERIRTDIQERLDQLLGEADKLRRALTALGSRDGATTASRDGASATSRDGSAPANKPKRARSTPPPPPASRARVRAAKPSQAPAAKQDSRMVGAKAPGSRARPPAGSTRNAVLAALSTDTAKTAGEVAAATGLGRASVSTTLSRLSKTGDVIKAQRGYTLSQAGPAPTAPDATAT